MKSDNFILKISAVAIPLFLMGCAAGATFNYETREVVIPITTITQYVDGRQMVLKGEIIGKQNMESTSKLSDGAGINCEGESNSKGDGEIRCTNEVDGTSIVRKSNAPKKLFGKLSGSYVDSSVDGETTAIGWGKDAVDEKLQRMLAAALG